MAHDVLCECPPLKPGAVVVLNGCQTYVKDRRSIDEGMGLATAFLSRGAGMVLGSMWNISDYAGAEVIRSFLQKLTGGWNGAAPESHSAPKQLKMAINVLRSASEGQVAGRVRECLALFPAESVEHEQAQRLSALPVHRPQGDEKPAKTADLPEAEDASDWFLVRPFEHPYYWAGFQLLGRFN